MNQRWQRWQERAAAVGSAVRRALRPSVLLAVMLVLGVTAATAVWAKSMVSPAYRVGNPSIAANSVTATPSPTPTITPTPTLTPTATSTAKATTMASSGKFANATLNLDPTSSVGEIKHFAVRVETSTGLNANSAATTIAAVLNDPRSWTGDGSVRFALVADATKADFTISLSSPTTAAKSCAAVGGTCVAGTEVVVDALALKNTASTYSNSADWQRYLINHGVGSWLGKKTATCTKAGQAAPVMMVQQASLGGCTANPWPRP